MSGVGLGLRVEWLHLGGSCACASAPGGQGHGLPKLPPNLPIVGGLCIQNAITYSPLIAARIPSRSGYKSME
jgi:hypothetical protein